MDVWVIDLFGGPKYVLVRSACTHALDLTVRRNCRGSVERKDQAGPTEHRQNTNMAYVLVTWTVTILGEYSLEFRKLTVLTTVP